jgi:hypothetical protein
VAAAGLQIHHPVAPADRLAWEGVRLVARLGGLRWAPGTAAAPDDALEILAAHLAPGETVAVARTPRAGKSIALLIDPNGTPRAFAKVGRDPEVDRVLDAEAAGMTTYGPRLAGPLSAPRVLVREPGLLLMDMAPWRARWRPWRLPVAVAAALGRFAASSVAEGGGFVAHRDVAPWHLLRTSRGWVLIDWENAGPADPFHDLFHFLVQSHVLLGHPGHRAVVEGLDGRGWVGACVRAYARGVGVPATEAGRWFLRYLEATRDSVDPTAPKGTEGLRARDRMAAEVGRKEHDRT